MILFFCDKYIDFGCEANEFSKHILQLSFSHNFFLAQYGQFNVFFLLLKLIL
jgi:hypothetical protein